MYICNRKRANQSCGWSHVYYSHAHQLHLYQNISKPVWAEQRTAVGREAQNTAQECLKPDGQLLDTKGYFWLPGLLVLLLVKASPASHRAWWGGLTRGLMGKLRNSHRNGVTCPLHQTICPLRSERDRRQPWGTEGLKAAGDSMSELKKQYASHCRSMFILPQNNQNPQ